MNRYKPVSTTYHRKIIEVFSIFYSLFSSISNNVLNPSTILFLRSCMEGVKRLPVTQDLTSKRSWSAAKTAINGGGKWSLLKMENHIYLGNLPALPKTNTNFCNSPSLSLSLCLSKHLRPTRNLNVHFLHYFPLFLLLIALSVFISYMPNPV